MYIPAKDENITETAEVRILSSTGTSTYRSPNYVTGVAGAFLSIVSIGLGCLTVGDTSGHKTRGDVVLVASAAVCTSQISSR